MAAAAPLKRARAAPSVAPRTRPPIQAKLDVGPTGDHYEREADHVAREVMQGGAGPVNIPPTITAMGAQRKIEAEEKPEEDKKVQRKAASPAPIEEEKKVQRKPAGPQPIEDDKKVQRKEAGPAPAEEDLKPGATKRAQRDAAAGAAGGEAGSSVESSIARMQSGSAGGLDHGTRSFMEGRFGRDFGGVRIHSGKDAAAAAQSLNARAFTVGRDVFFNAGQYSPHSPSGRELIAHELTHTVQQAGSAGQVGRKLQRATTGGAKPAPKGPTKSKGPPPFEFKSTALKDAAIQEEKTKGSIGIFTLPVLELPEVRGVLKGTTGGVADPVADKGRDIPKENAEFVLGPVPKRDDSKAFKAWTEHCAKTKKITDGVLGKLSDMVKTADGKADSKMIYYFTLKKGTKAAKENVFAGKLTELAKSDGILRPQWTRDGKPVFGGQSGLAADHFLELQLGGLDSPTNMWLLNAGYNSAVGSKIEKGIERDINTVLGELTDVPKGLKLGGDTEVKRNWTIKFLKVAKGNNFPDGSKVDYWTRDEIQAGTHLDQLMVMTTADLADAGLKMSAGGKLTEVKIFTSAAGGRMASLPINDDGTVNVKNAFLFRNVFIVGGELIKQPKGAKGAPNAPFIKLNIQVQKKDKKDKKTVVEEKQGSVDIVRMPQFDNAGYITRESLYREFKTLDFKPLCPIALTEVFINPEGEFVARGSIASEHALLPKLKIPFSIVGDTITVDFPIPAANVKLGPVSVVDTTLSLGVADDDFFLRGRAGILVKGLGSGAITAETKTGGSPTIGGSFDFDLKFFDPAQVKVDYDFEKEALSGSATLGIKKGVLPGVDSGKVELALTQDGLDASGTVDLAAPLAGVQLNVKYNKASGLLISADNIKLPFGNIPGVKDPKMSVRLGRKPGAKEWSIGGTGSAQLAVPNATGTLKVTYDDGLFIIHGSGTVKRDPVVGHLDFTAANAPVDEKGNPIKNKVGTTITAWGKGGVSATFGKIRATAGIEYTPDRRLLIDGKIALAENYRIFPKQAYSKELFKYRLPEFPIWGISFHGYGLGIMAFADVRVGFEAWVGPGEIRNAEIGATMDVAKPEEAKLHGHAEFYVPGYAGLVADLGGGLVARLGPAYAEGRVGLEGHLGFDVSAGAKVDIDWSKAAGLAIAANLSANVTPKLGLYVNASLTVGVNLLVAEPKKVFGPWSKPLGEIGPGMGLNVTIPVGWSDTKGLDLSIDKISVQTPNLDAKSVLKDTFTGLAGPATN